MRVLIAIFFASLLATLFYIFFTNPPVRFSAAKPVSPTKILLLTDVLGQTGVSNLRRKLIEDRQIPASSIEMTNVADDVADRQSLFLSLLQKPNLIVVSPKEEYAHQLSKMGFVGMTVVLAHGPWVDGRYNNWSESRSNRSVVISTHVDSDLACLNWMQQVMPNVKTVGVLAYTYTSAQHVDLLTKQAKQIGIKLVTVTSGGHEETMKIFKRAKLMNVEAWYVPHTPAAWRKTSQFIKLLQEEKIPTAFEYSHHYTKLGAMMSCGTDFDILETAADAIQHLQVSPSSMLTNEYRPTDLSVSWNQTTAEQLGLSMPRSLSWRVGKTYR
jgi:hypothetical protein